jgi:hypothetical protein
MSSHQCPEISFSRYIQSHCHRHRRHLWSCRRCKMNMGLYNPLACIKGRKRSNQVCGITTVNFPRLGSFNTAPRHLLREGSADVIQELISYIYLTVLS